MPSTLELPISDCTLPLRHAPLLLIVLTPHPLSEHGACMDGGLRQGCIRTADNGRSRGGCPSPGPDFHRGKY